MTENSRVLQAAMAEPWAITAEGLELVLSVAARETPASLDIQALEAYRAQHVPTAERMMRRGPVAVLDVRGPLFRHANIFTAISGATSYDVLRRDLQAALDDPTYRAVVLSFDTPGGEVTGVAELGDAIRDARAKKPIIAYVGGAAASAGYWLASQASEIVVAETAVLGSIGVRMAIQDTSERDAKARRFEFISSQSPGKRTDLSSDEGRGRIQRIVDSLAAVFIGAVAKGRGVTTEHVARQYGAGDVIIGAAALSAGMADRLGSFEQVVAELAAGHVPRRSTQPTRRPIAMTDVTRADHDAAVAAATSAGRAAGATAERARIAAIFALDEAKGREDSARHLALNTELAADVAKGVLAGLPLPVAADPAPSPAAGPAPVQRAKDARGGLVKVDPTAALPTAPDKAAALWDKTVARVNGKASA